MELLQERIDELNSLSSTPSAQRPSTARKIQLLQDSQTEVLLLTGPRFTANWAGALMEALTECAQRGLRVRLLLESGAKQNTALLADLRSAGIDVRLAPKRLSWLWRPFPVQSEIW